MSGKRDMFNILNVQMDDWASLTDVLHHTAGDSSRSRLHNWLRFRHFHDLALIGASQQHCAYGRISR